MTQVFDGDDAKILRTAEAFERLWNDDDFKLYLEFLQDSVDTWGTQAIIPAKEMMDLVRREYDKGVFFGLRLAITAKSNILSARNDILARRGTGVPSGASTPNEAEPEIEPAIEIEKGAP